MIYGTTGKNFLHNNPQGFLQPIVCSTRFVSFFHTWFY